MNKQIVERSKTIQETETDDKKFKDPFAYMVDIINEQKKNAKDFISINVQN